MAEKNSLWKNIRNKAKQNRESGATPKKPTTEMLNQERKIKAKQYAEGSFVGEDDRKKRELSKRDDNTDAVTRESKQGLGLLAQLSEDFDNAVAPYVPTGDIARQYYYNNYSPIEYPNPINAAVPVLKTAWNLINPANVGREALKSKIIGLSTPTRTIGLDKEGSPNIGEEAWKKALGLPTKEKYIVKSQYKPSSASDPNAEYYTINPNVIDKQKIIDYVKSEDFMKRSSEGKSPNSRVTNMDTFSDFVQDDFITKEGYKNGIEDYYQIDPIQKFQISKAWDPEKKKWYASIYDKYDFDSESANKAIKPYEIYDRVYYDSNEKPTVEKQSMVSKVAQAYGNPFSKKKAEGGYYPTQGPPKALFKGYAQGGYTDPYNQYQDDPYLNYAGGGYMYGNGGRTWKNIGAGAFGALEGLVDTTFGWIPGVDMATDMAYKGLQKLGGSSADEIREQDSIHGYAQTAGAVGSALLTSGATTANAISEGAQGLGQGISKGSETSDVARGIGTGLNIAGSIVGTAYGSTDAAKSAKEGFKLSEAGSEGLGKFAAAAPKLGQAVKTTSDVASIAPEGTKVVTDSATGLSSSVKPPTGVLAPPPTPSASSLAPNLSTAASTSTNLPSTSNYSNLGKIGDVTSSLSALPKSQEQPPMAEPVSVPAPPPLPPQTDYNQFAVNPPTINTGFETPEYDFGYNPSQSTFSQGGNMLNNSLNLRNTMRYKRFAKGGTFDQYGINMIPESAGLHHESANGGVPIGPDALAEGGEAKLQMADGGQYIVSGEVDGANTQSINGETMTQRLKKKLKPFMMGGLATNPKDKENVRRPFDSYSEPAITQAANAAVQETEAVKMQRGGALQYAANGGKLNKDIEKIVMEEYSAAYGGMLPNKYKGKVNMPNSYAKGGIHIKESKKGTFTAAATKHGKSVQEFAKQVLANKDNYSPEMVKKANFARNASKWNHADGGYVHNQMIQPMLAEGGPIYGDPASEYVYARGGMYGDPYARGGQIDYTNDMYAGGGPMVSNVKQPFKGPTAQNRGGMYIYADGGMMPQEQQMMQEQQMQQQGGQDQMMQMVQQVAQAIMQGENPEKIMAELANSGMPQEQVQQVMQAAMQIASQQQQQQPQGQPMQGQEQMMPPQGMMARGGRMRYDGGGTFGPITEAQAIANGYQPAFQDEIDYTQIPNFNTPTTLENLAGLKLPTYSTDNLQLPNNKLGTYTSTYSEEPGKYNINNLNRLKLNSGDYPSIIAGNTHPNLDRLPELPNNQLSPMPPSGPADMSIYNEDYVPGVDADGRDVSWNPAILADYDENDNRILVNPNTLGEDFTNTRQQIGTGINQSKDTPWYEEPFYSKAARYSQVLPGIAATITGMKNKKRTLSPTMMAAQKVNYEPERIVDRKESRRAYSAYADKARNMGNQGYANMKDALLNSNAALAGRIAESVMREANTNAQLAQQADLTNVANRNQFKQLNEQMFQNAQTQALAGLGDTTGKLANTAQQERKQYLQEWIARNRLKTRNYNIADSGEDLYQNNTDGYLYDSNGNRVQ